jgi:hypothetical protein
MIFRTALGRDPKRDHVRVLAEVDSVDHHHGRGTSSRRRLSNWVSVTRVRSMKLCDTDEFDVDRACCSTSRPTGSCGAPVG